MSSKKNWELRIDISVYKKLKRYPRKDVLKIMAAIEMLPFAPFWGDIQKIKGEENVWRKRNGNYRIFYEIIKEEKIIYVFLVERRTSKTYKKGRL